MTFTEEEFARYLRLQFFVGALSTQKTIGRAGRDDWGELLRWVNEGERAKQKVAELTSTVDALNISNRKTQARADEAEQQAAEICGELEREREKAQRIEHDVRANLEGTMSALTAERDGLKTALDETKTELAEVRKNFHDESNALRLLAADLGLNTKEITEAETEGKLFSFVRGEIKSLLKAGREEEKTFSNLCDVTDILEESGLRSKTGKDYEDLTDEEWQQWRLDMSRTLVASWLSHRPERLAVRALNDEQRQVIAKDKLDLEQKHRPTYPRRVHLQNHLGELPTNFIESGALSYRDDFDRKLGDDVLDWSRFDAFVEMLPRLRLNSKIDSWSKLSKEAHVHKQTLRRYADFIDLKQWLPKANEQSQQEDDADQE